MNKIRFKFEAADYQANCSEQTFKFTGTLEEIKKKALNMLQYIALDDPSKKAQLKEFAKTIKGITDLEEFDQIIIPFTCNYETYFRKNPHGEIEVATCNNVEWGDLDFEETRRDYDSISCSKKYLVVGDGAYLVLKKKYAWTEQDKELKVFKLLPPNKTISVPKPYGEDKEGEIISRIGGLFFKYEGNNYKEKAIPVEEILDPELKAKIAIATTIDQ